MNKSELIDAAVSIVGRRLPDLLTEEDNKKYIDQFLSSVKSP